MKCRQWGISRAETQSDGALGINKSCGRVCQKVLKNFGTAEFTSEHENTFYHLKTANLVLQTPNTGKR